ncbi:MAG TPA: hypothetical protein VEH52_11245 [Gaiellaceae bacterium]|nr:hypothetical protein [Gaiellaceae bacterium]
MTGIDQWLSDQLDVSAPATLDDLQGIVTDLGHAPWLWSEAVRFDLPRRSCSVLYRAPAFRIALFGWAAAQETTYHDHGGAEGAVFVCSGLLIEDVLDVRDGKAVREHTFTRCAESAFSFGAAHVHRVRHEPALGVSLSIHAYTPAVTAVSDYDVLEDGTLRRIDVEEARSEQAA